MKILLLIVTVVQALNLIVFAWFNRLADSRVATAARGIQAQIEETLPKKQRPTILVVTLEALERLEIRTDHRKARGRDPMEG